MSTLKMEILKLKLAIPRLVWKFKLNFEFQDTIKFQRLQFE